MRIKRTGMLLVVLVILFFSAQSRTTHPAHQTTIVTAPRFSRVFGIVDSARWYHYRRLSVFYDSAQLTGIYGEIFAIGADSTPVRFANYYRADKDTTLAGVNGLAVTWPFQIGNATSLSFFRCLIARFASPDLINAGIADSCAWVAELYNYQTNEKICTLDSIATLPLPTGRDFPTIADGSSNSFRMIEWDLSTYTFNLADSAYIRIKMYKFGSGSPGYSLNDLLKVFDKFSEKTSFQSEPKRNVLRTSDLAKTVDIGISPNPMKNNLTISLTLNEETSFSLEFVNPLGEMLQTIFSGSKPKGTHFFSYTSHEQLPAGLYFLNMRDLHTGRSLQKKFVITK